MTNHDEPSHQLQLRHQEDNTYFKIVRYVLNHDKTSQTTMKHHKSPQIFTNHHETLQTIMKYHESS